MTLQSPCSTPSTSGYSMTLAWSMFILAATFYSYEFLLRITPSVMVSALMTRYHINAIQLGLLDSSYYLAYTPLQLFVGPILDQYGVKKPLTMSALACAIGTFIFSISPMFYQSVIGRFLVGVGSAFAFVATLKLASEWLPKKFFPLASGLATMLGMLGAIGGEITLTHFVAKIGSEQALMISAYLAIALTILLWIYIRDKPLKNNIYSYTMFFEHLTALIKLPYLWLNGFIGMLLYLPITIFSQLWGIPYFEQIYHTTPHYAALLSTTPLWGWAVGGPCVGLLAKFFNRSKLIMFTGSCLACCLFLILLYGFTPPQITSLHFMILFLFGFFSSVQILVFANAKNMCAPQHTATAIALTNMLVMLCGAINPLIGNILEHNWHGTWVDAAHAFSRQAYDMAFISIPLGLLLAAIFSIALKVKNTDSA